MLVSKYIKRASQLRLGTSILRCYAVYLLSDLLLI
jgi:hypothetical protein